MRSLLITPVTILLFVKLDDLDIVRLKKNISKEEVHSIVKMMAPSKPLGMMVIKLISTKSFGILLGMT